MTDPLRQLQAKAGATFSDQSVPLSFGNDAVALQAAERGAALVDRSHWGRIRLDGADRLRFLHNQSTNSFQQRQPGQVCDTVFVTSTARTLDLLTAYILEDSVLLLVSPGQTQRLIEWMDRFIFFADKVSLTDVTAETATFSLVGPISQTLLTKIGAEVVANLAPGQHRHCSLGDLDVRIAAGSGFTLPGYTLICAADQAAPLWQRLTEVGAVPLGEQDWQYLRIRQGRPMPGAELSDDYNPLEAGLWSAIAFDKGCYIGQETIARLNTYQGVKQQLWGLKLSALESPGTPITVDGSKVGQLTSVIETPEGPFGLGYIRTKSGGAGLQVRVGNSEATVLDIPFASRGYLAVQPSE